MNKLSQLISLPVINIYNAKIEGCVENIYINSKTKKVEQLIVYDEDNDTYKTVIFSQIYKIGIDAIFIKNSSMITLSENLQPLSPYLTSPINAKCYDFDGKYMGLLQDILTESNAITSIIIDDNQYSVKSIVSLTNTLVLLSMDKTISIKRYRPYSKKIKVNTSSATNSDEPIVNILNSPHPTKQITNYNFLINRVIIKDIKTSSGEIIANKDTIITVKTINKLRHYGKLKELVLYSK